MLFLCLCLRYIFKEQTPACLFSSSFILTSFGYICTIVLCYTLSTGEDSGHLLSGTWQSRRLPECQGSDPRYLIWRVFTGRCCGTHQRWQRWRHSDRNHILVWEGSCASRGHTPQHTHTKRMVLILTFLGELSRWYKSVIVQQVRGVLLQQGYKSPVFFWIDTQWSLCLERHPLRIWGQYNPY